MAADSLVDSPEQSRSTTFAKLAYTVFWLNVFVLLIFLIGLLAGWFWPEAELVRNGAYRVSLVMNTQEAQEDLNDVAEATQNLAETGESAVEMSTIQGQIRSVDTSTSELTVVNEDTEYTAKITEATDFEVSGDGDIDSLSVGDKVRLTMKKKGDRYYAYKIAEAAE